VTTKYKTLDERTTAMTTQQQLAQRPLPRFPEPDSEPFWRATKDHKLTYQTCNDCKAVVFYPRAHCTRCGGNNLKWNESKGIGTVYTFSVVVQSRHPFFRDRVPYAVAYIDLDEGFRMMSNIVGVQDPARTVKIGMRVKVRWEDQPGGELSIPVFEPA
jgi:uncharacterized OB-fold protein